MGGHGALSLALKHPRLFQSVSALAPICAHSLCPWGLKVFAGYLGRDPTAWQAHDSSALMAAKPSAPFPRGILIDQGLADKFLPTQLFPEKFEDACQSVGHPVNLRRHPGYDHGYYFITTFMADQLPHHAAALTT
jgi:S-formylglutathione hydrolase